MKKLHILLLVLLIWSSLFSQQYINYTTKNGLPSNHIYRITQDYKGFIWFFTDKGIVKFNGTTFKIFTTKDGLPTNDIWDVRIGHDNKIWFFTKSNKLGYIENDKVYAFESEQKNEILYPVVISQNKNTILFSNGRKNYFLKGNLWKSQKVDVRKGYGSELKHKKVSTLFVKNAQDSLLLFDKSDKLLKAIKLEKHFIKNKHRGQINDSLFSWINNNKIYLLNLNTLNLKKISYDTGSKELVRYSAVNNNIQISGEDFVSFIDKNYQLKNTIHIPKNLNSHFSFVDKNKNLWIATFSNGVYYLSASKQKSKYSLVNEKVSKIKKVNNSIIASIYQKGFYSYDSLQNRFHPLLKVNDFIYSANYIKDLNTYYYVSDKEVTRIKNNKKKTFSNLGISRKLVYYNNFLYGNISSGLNKINPTNYKTLKKHLQNGIRDIKLFNGKIVIATANGIMSFSNDTITNVKIDEKRFDKPIASLSIYNNTNLILCTDGFGAYITDFTKIKLLEQSDFLNVQSAFIENGHIWLATNQGIFYYEKTKNTFQLKRKYTTNDGLSLNQTNSIIIVNDKILASSNNGISIIPIHQEKNKQFMAIYFDTVTYDNNPIINKKIKYSTNNQLQVKIASIDFSENPILSYKYQLLPVQKKWITTNSKQISFNNLPPNKYKLNIQSNGKKSTIQFQILALWYQTIIAKIIFSILFLSLFAGLILFIRKRELNKQVKKLNAQKKLADFELHALRSQMNPHFVFNSLNAIQYFITKNEIDLSEKYLVKFARLIRMFFDFSREKEIFLKEEIQLLNGYLEIEKMRFGENFNYQIKIINNRNVKDFKIPTMLLQPIVENAVNHGLFHNKGKGLIKIFFTLVTTNSIQICITDNGVGRKKSKEIQENSLKNKLKKNSSTNVIKERINLLNQTKKWSVIYETIDNVNSSGTTVNLTFTKNEYNTSHIS